MSKIPKRILIIAQGGGCRQIENGMGVLKAIDEVVLLQAKETGAAGIPIFEYRGASAGAIVSKLHAFRGSDRSIKAIKETPLKEMLIFSPWQAVKLFIPFVLSDYLYKHTGIINFLKKYAPGENKNIQVSVTSYPEYNSLMKLGTVETTTASGAIPEIIEPVWIKGVCYKDGGIKNNIPMIMIEDIPKYDHIYIILCNEDTKKGVEKKSWTKAGRSLKALNETMDREVLQVKEEGWGRLPNVTVIQPPPFRSHLLDWSKDFGLIKHSYEYTKALLSQPKN